VELNIFNLTILYVSGMFEMSKKIAYVDSKLKVDFIDKLSPEISYKILKMLDTKSLIYAARVSRKWEMLCECELKRRKVQYNDAYYEQLWELLMRNIEKTYGQRFPF